MSDEEFRCVGHAKDQMIKRSVTEEQIRAALRRESRRMPADRGAYWVWGYTDGGRILKVCVAPGDPLIVKTVAWPDEDGSRQ